jgi:DNA-binding response OmpR family regulator
VAKVLLIEPDAMLALTYARALSKIGHEVHAVSTAQAGINAADDVSPDIVLLELQLVTHSGLEFLYEFRSYPEWREIPVIVISHVPPAEFNQSIQMLRDRLGVKAYYYKPHTSLAMLAKGVDAMTVKL